MDFAGRREKLRKLLKKTGADALLVTSVPNVTYLTGFTGDSSFLLITQTNQILISDGRVFHPDRRGMSGPGHEHPPARHSYPSTNQ